MSNQQYDEQNKQLKKLSTRNATKTTNLSQ